MYWLQWSELLISKNKKNNETGQYSNDLSFTTFVTQYISHVHALKSNFWTNQSVVTVRTTVRIIHFIIK